MFNSHRQQTVSGFLFDPSEQNEAAKECRRGFRENQRKKVSHSGPLVQGTGWTKFGKDLDNPHVVSTRTNLSTVSGFLAPKTSFPDDQQGRPGTSRSAVVKQLGGFQGSSNGLEPTIKKSKKCRVRRPADSPEAEGLKSREASLVS